jgi:hypothetical protein
MTTIQMPAFTGLGPLSLEAAMTKLVESCGYHTTAYTLIVGEEQAGLAIRLMAVMPRLGCAIDDTLGSIAWKLAVVSPTMEVFCVECAGA